MSKKRWQYMILSYHKVDLTADDVLNGLGKDGWELVSIVPHNGIFAYCMKRKFRGKVKAQPTALTQTEGEVTQQ